MTMDSACQRKLCQNKTAADLVTRCGHKFHLSCLESSRSFKNYENKCLVCNTDIYKSKMIEEMFLQAKRQESPYYDELLEFIKLINDYRSIDVNYNFMKNLINLGFDLNSNDFFNERILRNISEKDNVHKLNILIDLGLDLKANNKLAKHVFMHAVGYGSFCILEKLKELDVLPKTIPLELNIEFRYLKIKWLIENGFDLNRKIGGIYPIHEASSRWNIDEVKFCLITVQILILKT